ncbi:MAG: AAA family ATPase [Candidatus Verstraetearchaeota archaeon]|nr:AAA family ATPase [Candidatus Verstraetearchaeota archaeon]
MGSLAILEVILENFMSYEYARIPLKRGLNIICGPNGAGKSSILLGISVAIGQSYTERSKKLSDLIRRGKDTARVTILLDNSKINKKRPISHINSDVVSISRYLKKDGRYWFEINGREVSKFDVTRIFKNAGINPDNMLVIMHQNMIEEFAIIPPEEKLKMVEEAVGFSRYREAIKEAENRLKKVIGEEEVTSNLLKSTEQILNYWKDKYEKYLEKMKLLERKSYLERELIWAQIIKYENTITQIEDKIKLKNSQLEFIKNEIIKKEEESVKLWNEYLYLKEKFRKVILENNLKEIGLVNEELDKIIKNYVNIRVDSALLNYKREKIEEEIKELYSSINDAKKALFEIKNKIDKNKIGERINTTRTISEISDELKTVNAHLLSLREIPDDTPLLYQKYLETYNELKQKIENIIENRKKLLEEIEERKKVWRNVMENLIEEINPIYKSILANVGGTGDIRISNAEDYEKAGIEITAGFRGSSPVLLGEYSQSGGERTVATTAFLLALQHHLKSPIRAIDEFDVHMDPRNREIMMNMIFSFVNENPNIQFIVITPSQISIVNNLVNIILVQNIHGKSEVIKTVT